MIVRAIKPFYSEPVQPGELAAMSKQAALRRLDSNYIIHVRGSDKWEAPSAEPLLYRGPHVARIDDDLGLSDAFHLQVSTFPGLTGTSEYQNERRILSLRTSLYRDDPLWEHYHKPPKYGRRVRSPGIGENYLGIREVETRTPAPSREDRYFDAKNKANYHLAIKCFIDNLVEERLVAWGVSEKDLFDDKRSKIPSTWWARNIRLDLRRDELCEVVPRNANGERRFSRIIVRQPDRKISMVSAETACKKWLSELAEDGDKPSTKGDLMNQALDKFDGLSKEAFERAWNTAAPQGWKSAGRRPKKSNPPSN